MGGLPKALVALLDHLHHVPTSHSQHAGASLVVVHHGSVLAWSLVRRAQSTGSQRVHCPRPLGHCGAVCQQPKPHRVGFPCPVTRERICALSGLPRWGLWRPLTNLGGVPRAGKRVSHYGQATKPHQPKEGLLGAWPRSLASAPVTPSSCWAQTPQTVLGGAGPAPATHSCRNALPSLAWRLRPDMRCILLVFASLGKGRAPSVLSALSSVPRQCLAGERCSARQWTELS